MKFANYKNLAIIPGAAPVTYIQNVSLAAELKQLLLQVLCLMAKTLTAL